MYFEEPENFLNFLRTISETAGKKGNIARTTNFVAGTLL